MIFDMQGDHKKLVETIASQVHKYFTDQRPFHIYHGSTNSTRILSFKRSEMIDVSQLNHVLSVNRKNRTAIVEPNVPMDKLVEATLKYGLIPPVVMEFPGITVGGGIQGGGGESSSFRWGFYNRIFNWYEMILADGEIIRASPKENADLFDGTAGSCGTLGIITSAEIQLIPAKKYVQLTYLPVNGFDEALAQIKLSTAEDYDFIDSILFGPDHGLIMLGKLSDNKVGRVQRFARAIDPWFYLHAEKIDRAKKQITESIPLVDYLFRYDRGAFWVGRYAFERFGITFNRFTRWLLDPILHTRKLYQALQDSGGSQEYLVQDLAVPIEQAIDFLQFVEKAFAIYPLWICPIKPDPKSLLQSNSLDTPLVINVGVWSPQIESYDKFVKANRLIEQKLQTFSGKKWLYAHCYYAEKEFWEIYDKVWYGKLRHKYRATSLPSIFDKIRVTKRYKLNARRGLFRTIFGRARLRIKD